MYHIILLSNNGKDQELVKITEDQYFFLKEFLKKTPLRKVYFSQLDSNIKRNANEIASSINSYKK